MSVLIILSCITILISFSFMCININRTQIKQIYMNHSAPSLDVDWSDDVTFASCSTDASIYVCRVGETSPIRCYRGHQNEVVCFYFFFIEFILYVNVQLKYLDNMTIIYV